MITADQIDFNTPADAGHDWVETMLFPVIVPEENIYALVYCASRPVLGTMANQIMIYGALSDTKAEMLHFYDNQHLPLPQSYCHITSPSGLEIRAVEPPRRFRIDYVAPDGTAGIHVDWEGMMEPFDIHDPNHSPQAGGAEDMHADIKVGAGHKAGHIDMTGRISGTLTVRGRTYQVDSIERMDRSWGPRNPMAIKNMYIVSATFGDDLAFHMICPWDPGRPQGEQFRLTHGYVLEGGKVYGLTDALQMRSVQHGLVLTALEMTVTDIRGKTFDLIALANTGGPWVPYPSAQTHNCLMRWRLGPRVGYGVVMANYSLPWLMDRHHRFIADPSPKIWV